MPNQQPVFVTVSSPISQAEVDEFRRLLERARDYDRRMNQPDCELRDKRDALLAIAKALGVDISFIENSSSASAHQGELPGASLR